MTKDRKKLLKAYRYALAYEPTKMGGIAGRGFTQYTWLECDKEGMHSNTNTPICCDKCRKKITKILREMWEKGELL